MEPEIASGVNAFLIFRSEPEDQRVGQVRPVGQEPAGGLFNAPAAVRRAVEKRTTRMKIEDGTKTLAKPGKTQRESRKGKSQLLRR